MGFSTVNSRLMTWFCWAGLLTLAIPQNVLPLVVVKIQNDLDLSDEEMGRCGSIVLICCSAMALSASLVSRILPAKFFVLSGFTLELLGVLLTLFSTNYTTLCVSMMVQGAGIGLIDMFMSPLIAAMHPDTHSTSLSLLHSFYCIGAVLVTLTVTILLNVGVRWRLAYGCLAPAPALLILLFASQKFPLIVEEAAGASLEMSWGELMRSTTFRCCFVMIFLAGACEVGPETWLPAFAEKARNIESWAADASLTLFAILMATGRLLGGVFAGRVNSLTLVKCCAACQMVAVLLAVLVPFNYAAVVCGSFIGISISMMWPTTLAINADGNPNGGAKMFAMMSTMGAAGSSLSPWIIGLVSDLTHSLRYSYAVGAAFGALMLLLMTLMQMNNWGPKKDHCAPTGVIVSATDPLQKKLNEQTEDDAKGYGSCSPNPS